MVAVYAYFINPGQPQSVYDAAAQWIAPWSSHVIGPLLFLWLNHRAAARNPSRPAMVFALAAVAAYAILDLSSVVLFGLSFATVLTTTFLVSLTAKTSGALVGAYLGRRQAARLASPVTAGTP